MGERRELELRRSNIQRLTYFTAPKWFNWVSGNVAYHNIHHLISAIPNCNLEKAHLALIKELSYKPISIFSVYRLLDYKLWNEDAKKIVGFLTRELSK